MYIHFENVLKIYIVNQIRDKFARVDQYII